MTTELREQPEDVRGRPAAVTLAGTIVAIGACLLVVWLFLGLQPHGGGRSNPQAPIALPTSQPYAAPTTPLEQRRIAEQHSIDQWLPAEIDRYLGEHR